MLPYLPCYQYLPLPLFVVFIFTVLNYDSRKSPPTTYNTVVVVAIVIVVIIVVATGIVVVFVVVVVIFLVEVMVVDVVGEEKIKVHTKTLSSCHGK